MIRQIVLAAALLAATAATSAEARPVTDCPNRDAPLSAASPMIDLLLNPDARALLNREMGGGLNSGPSNFFGTQPPTFSAILTLREAARFTRMTPARIEAIDGELRRIPVTPADKVARCARYDNEVPAFDLPKASTRILLFEKINGYKDEPSVKAAHAAIVAIARRKGWAIAATDKGGAFNSRTLRQFDAVIWNNVSGDVLTLAQRAAFKRWLERGGGFVGLHGSAGDPVYFWDWYPDTLIGARFIGHTMQPQFQSARVTVDQSHPLALTLPREWTMTDEWYSFQPSPRLAGARVLARLDEASYNPVGVMGLNIRMGDHPIAWTNCLGKGRTFYSAIGHLPATYERPEHVAMLEAAIGWVVGKEACKTDPR